MLFHHTRVLIFTFALAALPLSLCTSLPAGEASNEAVEWRKLRQILVATISRASADIPEKARELARILAADLSGPLPASVRAEALRLMKKRGDFAADFEAALDLLRELSYLLRYRDALPRAHIGNLTEFFNAEAAFNAYLDGPDEDASARLTAAAGLRGLTPDEVETLVRLGRRRPSIFTSSEEAEQPKGVYVFRGPSRDELEIPLKYRVLLPDDYHAARPKPLVIVLHDRGETAEDGLKRWGPEIFKRGWIGTAPECFIGRNVGYGALPEERALVLRLAADCRRRLAVDESRIHLVGNGMGGANVWDVSLTFPAEFASAVACDGAPCATAYGYLPVNLRATLLYCLMTRRFDPFLKRPAPCLNTMRSLENLLRSQGGDFRYEERWEKTPSPEYADAPSGTGREDAFAFAPAERALNWCASRRRDLVPEKVEFVSADVETNRCVWLEALDFDPAAPKNKSSKPPSERFDSAVRRQGPLSLYGKIGGNDEIVIRAKKVPGVRIYLSRNRLNLAKPLTVKINAAVARKERPAPALRFLLETARRLDDRRRLYWAAFDLSTPKEDR
jgi:pimeloyl-ACP methyl ester carboxylesterase